MLQTEGDPCSRCGSFKVCMNCGPSRVEPVGFGTIIEQYGQHKLTCEVSPIGGQKGEPPYTCDCGFAEALRASLRAGGEDGWTPKQVADGILIGYGMCFETEHYDPALLEDLRAEIIGAIETERQATPEPIGFRFVHIPCGVPRPIQHGATPGAPELDAMYCPACHQYGPHRIEVLGIIEGGSE